MLDDLCVMIMGDERKYAIKLLSRKFNLCCRKAFSWAGETI